MTDRELFQQVLEALEAKQRTLAAAFIALGVPVLNQNCAAITAVRERLAQPAQEPQGWYCAQCKKAVNPHNVTYHEKHTECGRVITNDSPPREPLTEEVVAFLLGEGSLDGVWFGDEHPTERSYFWWRKHLRAIERKVRG